MDRFEMADALRNRTGVTYEEAKKALEENNWDMLQAENSLNDNGKIKHAQKAGSGEDKMESAARDARGVFDRALAFIKELIRRGNRNYIVIKK